MINIIIKREGLDFGTIGKQMVYATALAMNRTMEEAQKAQQQGLYAGFTFRGTDRFFSNMVKIRPEDRAKKGQLRARLRIEGPEGALAKGALLTRHEEGGQRTTGQGGGSIDPSYRLKGMFYLPTSKLRPSFIGVIPRRMYPANLRLTERQKISGKLAPNIHRTRTGKTQLKGKERTFVLFSNTGQPWGIFQRIGASSTRYAHNKRGILVRRDAGHDPNIKQIWRFRPSITLKPRLGFERRVVPLILERFPLNQRGMLSHAIKTARP